MIVIYGAAGFLLKNLSSSERADAFLSTLSRGVPLTSSTALVSQSFSAFCGQLNAAVLFL